MEDVSISEIRKILNVSTTPIDIYRIAEKTCNIFTYPEIVRFKKIEQLFKKGNSELEISSRSIVHLPFDSKCCVILYMTGDHCGHWTILIKNKYGINFLDSYGDVVDSQFKYIDNDIPGQGNKHLIKLLLKYKGDVYYNEVRMQSLSDNVSTCGRYCALFLRYDYMLVDEFVKSIKNAARKNKITCDEVVCALSINPNINL